MGAFGANNACHNLAGYLFASACHFWAEKGRAPIILCWRYGDILGGWELARMITHGVE